MTIRMRTLTPGLMFALVRGLVRGVFRAACSAVVPGETRRGTLPILFFVSTASALLRGERSLQAGFEIGLECDPAQRPAGCGHPAYLCSRFVGLVMQVTAVSLRT